MVKGKNGPMNEVLIELENVSFAYPDSAGRNGAPELKNSSSEAGHV